jgi:hypothetical protein
MKRLVLVLSLVTIAGSVFLVARKRGSAPEVDDDVVMRLVAERAMPQLAKVAAKRCAIANPAANLSVDLSVSLRTLRQGVELLEVRLPEGAGAGVAGLDCLVEALQRTRFEQPDIALPEDREYALEISVPLPASSSPY